MMGNRRIVAWYLVNAFQIGLLFTTKSLYFLHLPADPLKRLNSGTNAQPTGHRHQFNIYFTLVQSNWNYMETTFIQPMRAQWEGSTCIYLLQLGYVSTCWVNSTPYTVYLNGVDLRWVLAECTADIESISVVTCRNFHSLMRTLHICLSSVTVLFSLGAASRSFFVKRAFYLTSSKGAVVCSWIKSRLHGRFLHFG